MNYDKNQNIYDARFRDIEKEEIRTAFRLIEPNMELFAIDYKKHTELDSRGWDILGRKKCA